MTASDNLQIITLCQIGVVQAAMGIRLKVLDPNENCPAASVAEQVRGDFSDFDTVRYPL